MAAPSVTARGTPTGFKMPDGYQTTIAFSSKPAINLWERTIKAPGIDGGDGIDTTTMLNTAYRTKDARHLKTLTESSAMCAYDPDVYTDIILMINVTQSITVHFPDGSSLSFWGFMQKFEPGELKEGEFPEASVMITPTNWDATLHVEAAPVFTAAVGT